MNARLQNGVLQIMADFGGFKSAIPKRCYSEDLSVQCSPVT